MSQKFAIVSQRGLSSPRNVKLQGELARQDVLGSPPVICGGAGAKLLRIMLGDQGETLWSFTRGGTSLWDVCAADAILTSVGGKLTDADGKSIDYREEGRNYENREGVIASLCPVVHGIAVEELRKIKAEEEVVDDDDGS